MNGTNLPYVLVADPFWNHPQKSPWEVLSKMISELKTNYSEQKFCIVADSHYDSKEVFGLFEENSKTFYFCIGLVSSRHADIHEILQMNTHYGE
jgi:hypothetical protein